MIKKRKSFWLIWLATVFFLALGWSKASAAVTQVLPDGSYDVQTSYYSDDAAKQASTAMNSFWGQSSKLIVKNNQATLTFTQKSAMSMMTDATFDGHQLRKTVTGQTGTWSVNLSPQEAVKLATQSVHSGTVGYNVNGYKSTQNFYVKFADGIPAVIEQPGKYQLDVKYDVADGENGDIDSGEPSMIQSGGLWANQITYHLNSDGTADLTLAQPKMMDYMTWLSIDGQKMTKQVTDAKATSGNWTVTLPLSSVEKLAAGKTLIGNMSYTVPNLFTHNVNVIIVINDSQLITADPLATTAVPEPTTDANEGNDSQSVTNSSSTTQPTTSNSSTVKNLTGSATIPSTETSSSATTVKQSPSKAVKTSSSAVKNEQSATSTMNVIYNKIGSHGEDLNQPSMIQSDNIWSDNILLEKNDDGTVKVTLLQPRLMDYMTSVSFAGVSMVKHVTSTNDAVKGSGSWTAILSKEQATKLKVGNKIAVQVSYTVPGAFTHNESALVVIKSITAGQPKDVTSIVKTASSGTTDQLAPVVAVTGKPSISSMSNTAAPAAVDTTSLTGSKNKKFLPQTGNSGSLFLTILGIMVLAITAIIGMFNLRRKNEKEF